MAHFHEADHVDEEARPLARDQSGFEHVDPGRHLRQHGLQRILQHFEARQFGAAQFGDHVRALRILDAGAAHGGRQTGLRLRDLARLIVHGTLRS